MSFENKISKFYSKSGLRIALTFSITLLAIGAISVALSSEFANAQVQSNSSTTINTTAAKPVDGYNTPQGHLSAIRHVFDDPALRVQHYCKPNDKIVLVCQLYDSISSNATLIGIEYIITADQYKALPDREKPNWHYHAIEFATNRADPMFPELAAAQAKAVSGKLMDTYGKVILTWDPKDKLPVFPAQVEIVQHPFMVNQTITPQMNKYTGSFNQTLKY
ncbi:MAG: OBAP family protein [Thermoproteota archaeon]|nr:OBAP family protein [Thermoproteota archaeon]